MSIGTLLGQQRILIQVLFLSSPLLRIGFYVALVLLGFGALSYAIFEHWWMLGAGLTVIIALMIFIGVSLPTNILSLLGSSQFRYLRGLRLSLGLLSLALCLLLSVLVSILVETPFLIVMLFVSLALLLAYLVSRISPGFIGLLPLFFMVMQKFLGGWLVQLHTFLQIGLNLAIWGLFYLALVKISHRYRVNSLACLSLSGMNHQSSVSSSLQFNWISFKPWSLIGSFLLGRSDNLGLTSVMYIAGMLAVTLAAYIFKFLPGIELDEFGDRFFPWIFVLMIVFSFHMQMAVSVIASQWRLWLISPLSRAQLLRFLELRYWVESVFSILVFFVVAILVDTFVLRGSPSWILIGGTFVACIFLSLINFYSSLCSYITSGSTQGRFSVTSFLMWMLLVIPLVIFLMLWDGKNLFLLYGIGGLLLASGTVAIFFRYRVYSLWPTVDFMQAKR